MHFEQYDSAEEAVFCLQRVGSLHVTVPLQRQRCVAGDDALSLYESLLRCESCELESRCREPLSLEDDVRAAFAILGEG